MKGNLIFGILVIVFGLFLLGSQLDWWDISLFFDGWWTLFIIVPSILSISRKQWYSGTIGLVIGFLLLLSTNDIIEWSLIVPIFVILCGVFIIFFKNTKTINFSKNNYTALFSGSEINITTEVKNENINVLFGGVSLDYREATFSNDITINCSCVFGGIDIIFPDNVTVVIKGVPIFGSIENKSKSSGKYIVTIDALCVFGGIDIK